MNNNLKYFIHRKIALLLSFVMLFNVLSPGVSLALTSGPSQPEVQSFEPIGTTEMVDLFTGDFTYNIPLFEVPGPNGGYPVNLHYNAGINMDQEASWVGLGWNINPGAINRQLQGLPDEYKDKEVTTELDIEPSVTAIAGFSANIEVFGGDPSSGGNSNSSSKYTPELGVGLSIKYNNFRGVGYEIGPSFGITREMGSDYNAGMSLNLSIDTETGIGVDLQSTISKESTSSTGWRTKTKYSTSYYAGIGYNSEQGFGQYSLGRNKSSETYFQKVRAKKNKNKNGYQKVAFEKYYDLQDHESNSGSSNLSFSSIGYLPYMPNAMETRYTSIAFKTGGSVFGVFGDVQVTGSVMSTYNPHKIQNNVVNGYLYAENDSDEKVLDFNRESDGPIHKNTPVLPIPIATPDIFSMTSHGVSTMFRAFRNDFGIYHDARSVSKSVGANASADVGPSSHLGIGFVFGYGESIVDRWTTDNSSISKVNFRNTSGGENYYFKTYGESNAKLKDTYEALGGDNPMRIDILSHNLSETLDNGNGYTKPVISEVNTANREIRNTPVQYIDPNNPKLGMYVINTDGSRYTYGKAQMVKKSVESMFSIDAEGKDHCTKVINDINMDGNKPKYKNITGSRYIEYFYKRNTLTDYAYSYLITEIKGADYIDTDGNGQVNDGDKGYWVKFNYTQVNSELSPYKWRTPFLGANYLQGKATTLEDDKAQYSYGEKEVYYLQSIETNSHIATFVTSDRKDSRGAYSEFNNSGNPIKMEAYSKKLECIQLKSKADPANNLLKVYLEYSYDLCKNVPNNDATIDNYSYNPSKTITNNKGKLTLKKVWIEYEKNKRGKMTPYVFDYNESVALDNPDYSVNNYDRWGSNRSTVNATGSDCDNPYVPQGSSNKEAVDRAAAAWSLRSISLPSGAKINVDYESDDYAYVQNKRATRMFKISNLTTENETSNSLRHPENERVVFFQLEAPITKSPSDSDDKALFEKRYLNGNRELYFRLYVELTNSQRQDWVSGYAPIVDWGLAGLNAGNYTKGFIKLGNPSVGNKTFPNFHPMALAGWQTLMTDYPELRFNPNLKFSQTDSKSVKRAKLRKLVNFWGQLQSMFVGFYSYANSKGYGRNIDLARSFIRLNDPDQIKFGGGLRVKKITISDQWQRMHSGAPEATYGQVYEYTTQASDGSSISSGVATYEPQIGGDENALKTQINYVDKIPMKLGNRVCLDLPVNESYYPAASVGYSKVTVKSLASHNHQTQGGTGQAYQGILTSGASVTEFYTCKDFPVKTAYTTIDSKKRNWQIPIPFVGSWTDIQYTGTQGFMIKLNDMHGKVRRLSTFKQHTSGAIDFSAPEEYSEIEYFANKVSNVDPEKDYYELDCAIPVLVKENGILKKSMNYRVGEQIEFFTDMRENKVRNNVAGGNGNLELIKLGFIPFPVPSVWPSYVHEENRVRTCVTNKIIHQFGTVKSITSYNGSSRVITKNEVFDALTGQVVMTSVNNNYNDPQYTYTMPAYYVYDGMKPSYETVGLRFDLTVTSSGANNLNKEYSCNITTSNASVVGPKLVAGDMLRCVVGNTVYTGVVTRPWGTSVYVQFNAPISVNTVLNCSIEWPGRRNLLNEKAGAVTVLKPLNDPLAKDPIEQLYP